MAKPSIPKGTRDFSPQEVAKRGYIISILKKNFEKFGFQPIETPTFENLETLMGKYGEEGDRLIFKILNSGDFIKGAKNLIEEFAVLQSYLCNDILTICNIVDHNTSNIEAIRENIEFYIINDPFNKYKEKLNFQEDYIINNLVKFIQDIIADKTEIDDLASKLTQEKSYYYNIDNLRVSEFLYATFNNIFNSHKIASQISEKALRYDLTVPFARYVVQHQNEIDFPFKRYQIQPVWRADRPQKGRFREFYQCDADVVGSNSLWQEVEFVQLYDKSLSELGLEGATIKINNRKVLSGIAEVIGAKDKLIDFTVALDKLDKIGEDGVKKEMLEKGISEEAIQKVHPLFNFIGTTTEKLNQLAELLQTSEEGTKGVEELRFICEAVDSLGLYKSKLDLDVTLARGLNYYTGAIFEVQAPKVAMGSIGGGGRYDDLTELFDSKNKLSGVGISFGLDRIYLVLEELGLFPEDVNETSKAMFANFGNNEALYSLKTIKTLRENGIKTELYPDKAKLGKQFQYADKRTIPFVVVTGEEEMKNQTYQLKNLSSGEQISVSLEELIDKLR